MSEVAFPAWAWLSLAALGVFHGINPAMGWLFAVALGLHRGEQRAVLLALVPLALGHALAAAAALFAFTISGLVVNAEILRRAAGGILIGWAIWHAVRGHRRPLRVGMQTGLAGLAAWSFMMASAHGAGLMLIPVLAPLCGPGSSPFGSGEPASPLALALGALAIHGAAMLAASAAVAIIVYRWVGVAFLRRGWLNIDALWTGALLICGLLLLVG